MTPPDPQHDPALPAGAVTDIFEPFDDAPTGQPVPQQPVDKWAHRRAEPRPLALLWTLYLFTATIFLLAVKTGGIADGDVYRAASRLLVITVGVGMSILWPMLRMSQSIPHHSIRKAALGDALVIIAPMHAVLWPLVWLAGWPFKVVAALILLLTIWGLFAGGILSIAYLRLAERADSHARTNWMFVFVGIALAPALVAGLQWWIQPTDPALAGWPALLSPVTLVFAVTREIAWAGPIAQAPRAAWIVAALLLMAAITAWSVASILARGRRH